MPLGVLLRTSRTLGDGHSSKTNESNLGASGEHEAAESVFGFAVGGQTDIEGLGTRGTDCSGGVDQIDLLLGDVGHEDGRILVSVFAAEIAGTIPRDGQVLASSGNGDIRHVRSSGIADAVEVGQVDVLCIVGDDGVGSELLSERVATGHVLRGVGEEESQLLVGELACQILNFLEEVALNHLCGGLGVPDALGLTSHVGDAVPRRTDDRPDFTFESAKDSLLDFSHNFKSLESE